MQTSPFRRTPPSGRQRNGLPRRCAPRNDILSCSSGQKTLIFLTISPGPIRTIVSKIWGRLLPSPYFYTPRDSNNVNRNMPVAYCCHQCKHWWLHLFLPLAKMQTSPFRRTAAPQAAGDGLPQPLKRTGFAMTWRMKMQTSYLSPYISNAP